MTQDKGDRREAGEAKTGIGENTVDIRSLSQIRELFHGLIRSRCREGGLAVPRQLPAIDALKPGDEPEWFAVPGMYGGFAYRLVEEGKDVRLIAESWCRVVGGSGMRHVITPTQVVLEEEGFV